MRNYQQHAMVASQEFTSAQEKGEYMPKQVRNSRVKEVRTAHFTLGYEPTQVPKNVAEEKFIEEKWNV